LQLLLLTTNKANQYIEGKISTSKPNNKERYFKQQKSNGRSAKLHLRFFHENPTTQQFKLLKRPDGLGHGRKVFRHHNHPGLSGGKHVLVAADGDRWTCSEMRQIAPAPSTTSRLSFQKDPRHFQTKS
jgi:hypothetical protein